MRSFFVKGSLVLALAAAFGMPNASAAPLVAVEPTVAVVDGCRYLRRAWSSAPGDAMACRFLFCDWNDQPCVERRRVDRCRLADGTALWRRATSGCRRALRLVRKEAS